MRVAIPLPGVQSDYREKYIGTDVVQALATTIGCDNSRADRCGPQSPYESDIGRSTDAEKTEG